MKPASSIPCLVLLILAPATAPDATAQRLESRISAPCSTDAAEDRSEQIADALHEFTMEPVRQGRGNPQQRLRALQAETRDSDGDRPRPETGRGTLADGSVIGRERCPAAGAASSAQPVPGSRELMALLEGSGMAWADACALAGAHAQKVDWLTASRGCVTGRTGATSYREFVNALLRGHISAEDACVAAEHYWNGLSEAKARAECSANGEGANP